MSPLDERGQPCHLMVKKDCYVPHEYEGLFFPGGEEGSPCP